MSNLEEKLKQPSKPEKNEIHEIITFLRGSGGSNDGDYRSKHLGMILEYLYLQKRESKAQTLQKLALRIGMSQRQVRENYVDGLIAYGIIQLASNCDEWFWVGTRGVNAGDTIKILEKTLNKIERPCYTVDLNHFLSIRNLLTASTQEQTKAILAEPFNDTLKRVWLKEIGVEYFTPKKEGVKDDNT